MVELRLMPLFITYVKRETSFFYVYVKPETRVLKRNMLSGHRLLPKIYVDGRLRRSLLLLTGQRTRFPTRQTVGLADNTCQNRRTGTTLIGSVDTGLKGPNSCEPEVMH